jgi:hypothetical protein
MTETVTKPVPFEATAKSLFSQAGTQQVTTSFDRSMHQPFTIDHRGMNKELNQKDMLKKETLAG